MLGLTRTVALLVLFVAACAAVQTPWHGVQANGYERSDGHRDQGWAFCTFRFDRVRNEASGSGWATDWPKAQANLMARAGALTTIQVEMVDEHPQHYVVDAEASGDALSTCPFIFTSDYGTMGLSPVERANLRSYLLKGGIFWADDAWGPAAWDHFEAEMARVLPEHRFEELSSDHPVLTQPYAVELEQISNIGFWSSAQETSERGEETDTPRLLGISDEHGRLMVLASHDTDLADPWEHDRASRYFDTFGAPGYAIGINVILYAMTH